MNEKIETKICVKCREVKDINLFIKKSNTCKSCKKDYQSSWYRINKDRILIDRKEYYKTNKEKISEYEKAYYLKNKEKIDLINKNWRENNTTRNKEVQKLWRENNKERKRECNKIWNNKNIEKNRQYKKNWDKRNPDKTAAKVQQRNARKLQAQPKWANEFFIKEAYTLAKLRSDMFGFKWHVDHIVPLRSNLVCGLHCEDNLQVIPASYNISKSNKHWPDMP